MDTSETYIKMCDCPEIQELWAKYTDGYEFCHEEWRGKKPLILHQVWLPRQDQIQEMMENKKDGFALNHLIVGIYSFYCKNWYHDKEFIFDSLEKYWLTFYMHEKHQKIWDGEKWEKMR